MESWQCVFCCKQLREEDNLEIICATPSHVGIECVGYFGMIFAPSIF